MWGDLQGAEALEDGITVHPGLHPTFLDEDELPEFDAAGGVALEVHHRLTSRSPAIHADVLSIGAPCFLNDILCFIKHPVQVNSFNFRQVEVRFLYIIGNNEVETARHKEAVINSEKVIVSEKDPLVGEFKKYANDWLHSCSAMSPATMKMVRARLSCASRPHQTNCKIDLNRSDSLRWHQHLTVRSKAQFFAE
jgi:hypothetical protein